MMDEGQLIERLKAVHRRIAHAAMRAGREPADVSLIAVSKTVPAEMIIRAVEAGVRDFGENRVQEAERKIPACNESVPTSRIIWHLIGHLQRNKARTAVRLFDLIHSVDSLRLAEELNSQAGALGKTQRVLVQVNVSGEETKYGIGPKDLIGMLDRLRKLQHITVAGLMTIPPFFEESERARPFYAKLRALRDEAERSGHRLPELSMGMSNDFDIAVEEGTTMVRVGTAIFGERSRA